MYLGIGWKYTHDNRAEKIKKPGRDVILLHNILLSSYKPKCTCSLLQAVILLANDLLWIKLRHRQVHVLVGDDGSHHVANTLGGHTQSARAHRLMMTDDGCLPNGARGR